MRHVAEKNPLRLFLRVAPRSSGKVDVKGDVLQRKWDPGRPRIRKPEQ